VQWFEFATNGGTVNAFRGIISTAGKKDRKSNSATVPPIASALIRGADVDRPRVRSV